MGMYDLGLSNLTKWQVGSAYIMPVFGTDGFMGRLASIHEILRIPLLDNMFVFLLYGMFLAVSGITKLFRRTALPASSKNPA